VTESLFWSETEHEIYRGGTGQHSKTGIREETERRRAILKKGDGKEEKSK